MTDPAKIEVQAAMAETSELLRRISLRFDTAFNLELRNHHLEASQKFEELDAIIPEVFGFARSGRVRAVKNHQLESKS